MADIQIERDQKRALKVETINDSASGDNTIVAAVTGKKIKVYAICIVSSGTVAVKFKDGAGTDITGPMALTAQVGFSFAVAPPAFLLSTSAGNAFIMNLGSAVEVDGWIAYWDDDSA